MLAKRANQPCLTLDSIVIMYIPVCNHTTDDFQLESCQAEVFAVVYTKFVVVSFSDISINPSVPTHNYMT
jgi:hypothetical protein